MTNEEAHSIARTAIIRAEVEGCWIATCECGQDCGVALVEPNDDDKRYVACPACDGDGSNGKVQWARRD